MADLSGLTTNYFATPKEGFTTTTAGSTASGAATVTLNSVTGYTNGAIATFVIEPTSSTAKQAFTGIVDTSGVQLTSVKWTEGTNQTHNAGSTVVDYTTATHFAALVKGLLAAGILQTGLQTPKIFTSINDSSGNEAVRVPATASAVNDVTVTNAATGAAPSISASGDDAAINLNLKGKGLAKTVTIGAGAVTIFPFDYVASGCVWSGDAYGSTLLASMTAGVVVINGNPVTVAAVTSRAFTASKDVYVDCLDNGDGTGLLVYTNGTTNAASGALAANSVRIAIIVTGATNIAAATSVNQGQETMVVPIASSVPYSVTDSLGNLICPRDATRRTLGYRQLITSQTTSGAGNVQLAPLIVPIIIPTGRKIKAELFIPTTQPATAFDDSSFTIWTGSVGGTQLQEITYRPQTAGSTKDGGIIVRYKGTPASGSLTFYGSFRNGNAGSAAITALCTATTPGYLTIETA